jgi:hypothetical protein
MNSRPVDGCSSETSHTTDMNNNKYKHTEQYTHEPYNINDIDIANKILGLTTIPYCISQVTSRQQVGLREMK